MQQLRYGLFAAILAGAMWWQFQLWGEARKADLARAEAAAAAHKAKAREVAQARAGAAAKPKGDQPAAAPPAVKPAVPRQTATLGDGKDNGDYRLLATLTSYGAGIESLTVLPQPSVTVAT